MVKKLYKLFLFFVCFQNITTKKQKYKQNIEIKKQIKQKLYKKKQ